MSLHQPVFRYPIYQQRPSRQIFNSPTYTINRKHSVLNFIPAENSVNSEIEKETNLHIYYISSVVKKWIAIITLGFFIGILGAFQAIFVEEILIFKYMVYSESLQKSIMGSSFIWISYTVFPILLCSYLIVYVEPTLKGCGVASAISYLNGVRVKRFHKALTLLLQYLFIFLISLANMPGGREELFIHVGALAGAYITGLRIPFKNWKPFVSICDSSNKRDLVAAGTAAGVAVAFGTPIGAVLFCLEEGLTYWSTDLTFLMFLCTICSNFVLHLSFTVYRRGGEFPSDFMYYLFFSGVDNIDLSYKFSEIPFFILMGIIGGTLGSLWNEGQIFLHTLRKKYITTYIHKILEVVLLGLVISLCGIVAFHSFGSECTEELEIHKRISTSKQMKKYCKGENEFETIGIFLFQDLRRTIKTIFFVDKELINTSVLLFGAAYYYIFSELQLGTHLPSGVLIPHLICGASWGYLFGVWYSDATEENLTIAKYAFLGAVAQASGAARLTLSLGMIMIESCGQQVFAIPVFIIAVTAKWFGGIFSRPIYRIEVYLEGYPFIRATNFPISTPYKAKHIMSSSLVTIRRNESVGELLGVLKSGHHSFPIIENGKVLGIITKYQIAIILKRKTVVFPDDLDEMQVMYKMFQEYQSESFSELKEVRHSKETLSDSKTIVDLTNFMNTSPYLINLVNAIITCNSYENSVIEMSLRRIYLMFIALGLSCAVVVDDTLNAVGIITRKDVACYKKKSQFLMIRTEVVPIV